MPSRDEASSVDTPSWAPSGNGVGGVFERGVTTDVRRVARGTVANGGYWRRGAPGGDDRAAGLPAAEELAGWSDGHRTPEPVDAVGESGHSLAKAPYRIVRSGRPSASSSSSLAYDGDPGTTWSMVDAAIPAYAWFDLGSERLVTAVRWLSETEGGQVKVQVSSDRSRWQTVGEGSGAGRSWQSISVTRTVRYVRFVFAGTDDAETGARLAEVEIYGPPDADVRESAGRDLRVSRDRGGASGTDDERASAGDGEVVDAEPDRTRSVERSPSSDEAGRRAGQDQAADDGDNVRIVEPDVVEEREIEVSVEAGTAVCDESGGDRNEAGRGKGASAGNGGTCRKDASGGAVEMGDVTP